MKNEKRKQGEFLSPKLFFFKRLKTMEYINQYENDWSSIDSELDSDVSRLVRNNRVDY